MLRILLTIIDVLKGRSEMSKGIKPRVVNCRKFEINFSSHAMIFVKMFEIILNTGALILKDISIECR